LKDEKAIVSEIPGTTRDYIEDTIEIDGILYRFIDTAGLRETVDIIENLGIDRTYKKIREAEIILLVADINEGISALNEILIELREEQSVSGKDLIILVNKIDNDIHNKRDEFMTQLVLLEGEKLLFISAKNSSGIEELKSKLGELVGNEKVEEESIIITNIRHYDALLKVSESLERVLSGIDNKIPEDLIAIDVRQAIHYLGEISGEITTDEILGNIFKNFCIGK
jgi:tRNA modification GTPase